MLVTITKASSIIIKHDQFDCDGWLLCRMAVLNDFEACGYGVPALQPEDLLVLNDVPARQKVSPKLHLLNPAHRVQLHHVTWRFKSKTFCARPLQARKQVSPLQH